MCVSVNVGMCVRVIGVCVCSQRRYVCACDRCVCVCACDRCVCVRVRVSEEEVVGRRVGCLVRLSESASVCQST